MRTPEELTELFRAEGLKVTPQRQAVFEALHGDEGHPTADMVWSRVREQMPTVSLRTVYQALNDLVELGEVQSVTLGDGVTRFDPRTSGHDHFVCRRCQQIFDVMASKPRVLAGDGGLEDAPGFTIEQAEIIFRGVCATCSDDSEL